MSTMIVVKVGNRNVKVDKDKTVDVYRRYRYIEDHLFETPSGQFLLAEGTLEGEPRYSLLPVDQAVHLITHGSGDLTDEGRARLDQYMEKTEEL